MCARILFYGVLTITGLFYALASPSLATTEAQTPTSHDYTGVIKCQCPQTADGPHKRMVGGGAQGTGLAEHNDRGGWQEAENILRTTSGNPKAQPSGWQDVDTAGQQESQTRDPLRMLIGEGNGLTVLNVANPEDSIVVTANQSDVYSADFKNKTIFVAGDGKILSTTKSGVNVILEMKVDGPVRLAVDWVHDRIYWVSDKYQTLEVANLDGSDRKTLFGSHNGLNITFPNNIAVDPYDGYIFFVSNHTIYRSSLNGSSLQRLKSEHRPVKCLALDFNNKRVYYTGKSSDVPYLASADYSAVLTNHTLGDRSWTDIYGLAVFRHTLYFLHYTPISTDSLWSIDLSARDPTPTQLYVSPASRGGIWSMMVDHPDVHKPA